MEEKQRKREAQWRLERSNNWLWVDALCIDQTNLQERMHQVRVMSRIFAGASEVLNWLGLANKEVDDLIKPWKPELAKRSPGEGQSILVPGLQDFCERPYWRRLWVLQELKMARKIVLACGPHTLDWEVFVAILYKAALGITGNNTPSRRRESFELDMTRRETSIYGTTSYL